MSVQKIVAVLFVLVGLLLPPVSARAAVDCSGKVTQVYKWHNMGALSMRVKLADGTVTNWIGLPSKSDEAAALMALAGAKPVYIYWAPSDVTKCVDGWDHNRALNGYFVVME
ncbi:hypothetical protein [Ideonella paludis]|uniref:Uncharacterized protein n=1 Tax=Ideonella paludis TaxID=1233411 RepID=A0ABS5DVD1_9BURK|nr:hypothetical protein [Ideonella paludis]MBQ0935097.1 hypothetical protein [Ideonella paludis]